MLLLVLGACAAVLALASPHWIVKVAALAAAAPLGLLALVVRSGRVVLGLDRSDRRLRVGRAEFPLDRPDALRLRERGDGGVDVALRVRGIWHSVLEGAVAQDRAAVEEFAEALARAREPQSAYRSASIAPLLVLREAGAVRRSRRPSARSLEGALLASLAGALFGVSLFGHFAAWGAREEAAISMGCATLSAAAFSVFSFVLAHAQAPVRRAR